MNRLVAFIKENLMFLREYISRPRSIGAVVPSSPTLAKNIVSFIDFNKDNLVILEYGPGTGPFTSEIVKYLKPGDLFIVIEQNKKFVTTLNQKFKNTSSIKIYHEDVKNVNDILKNEMISGVDYIVSGIPFSSLSRASADKILTITSHLMSPSSLFIAFQYTTFKLRDFKKNFVIVKKKFVFKNIPSAHVIAMKSKF